MAEVTLAAIEALLDLKLDEKFDAKLEPIMKILESHTIALDAIAKNTTNWQTEMTVMRNRLDRYEQWAKQVSEKLGIHLEF